MSDYTKKTYWTSIQSFIAVVALLILCTLSATSHAFTPEPPLSTEISLAVKEQGNQLVVLTITPDAGWYTYSTTPGSGAKPTKLVATLNNRALTLLAPKGIKTDNPFTKGQKLFVYKRATSFYFHIPQDIQPPYILNISIDLLACKDTACLPVEIDLSETLSLPALSAEQQSWWENYTQTQSEAMLQREITNELTISPEAVFSAIKPQFSQPSLEISGLLKAIMLGLIAGFVLNFMPCVLPVISLKFSALLSSYKETDQQERIGKFREHNGFFVLGVLTYFGALSIILGLTGKAWGAAFQQPEVVQALCVAVFLFGLSLFGVFNLPIIDLKADQHAKNPKLQPFLTGIFATLLATPCSGPFLGGVLGWALIQPPYIISVVFIAVGVGMSLPYIILSAFPALVRHFPRPGAWTVHLERLAGLLLFATAIYLMSILPDSQMLMTMILLWFFGTAAWIWGFSGPHLAASKRILFAVSALIIAAGGVWFTRPDTTTQQNWNTFNLIYFDQIRQEQPVLVDFTADWCPSCKALEHAVFTDANIKKWKEKYNMAFIQVDLTESNPVKESFLKALGSRSIPVVAVFNPQRPNKPIVLRDIFTTGQLEKALQSSLTQQ